MPKPISYPIRFYNPETGTVETAQISSTCRQCGENRGRPKIVQVEDLGEDPILIHRWKNKCGHVDNDQSITNEVALQCISATCVTLVSLATYYPYCGEECVVHAGLNIIGDLRSVITRLDGVSEVLGMMLTMLQHPDLTVPTKIDLDGAMALWTANCTQTMSAISRAQMCLLEGIAYGSRGYSMDGTVNYGKDE